MNRKSIEQQIVEFCRASNEASIDMYEAIKKAFPNATTTQITDAMIMISNEDVAG